MVMNTIISLINIIMRFILLIIMMPIFMLVYIFASIIQIVNDEIESEN